MVARMEPKEAAQRCAGAANTLTQAMAKTADPNALSKLTCGLSVVAVRMEPNDAAQRYTQAVDSLFQAMATLAPVDRSQELSELLTSVERAELSRRTAVVLAAIGAPAGTGQPLAIPAILAPALERLPCRLSTQQLVELLKQPMCIGLARRVILDQLQNRYRRPFADQWAFVRFAQEHGLGLDFTSPPQRLVAPVGGGTK
jgi:hypothetical protein